MWIVQAGHGEAEAVVCGPLLLKKLLGFIGARTAGIAPADRELRDGDEPPILVEVELFVVSGVEGDVRHDLAEGPP
jgi:hypothetical protein